MIKIHRFRPRSLQSGTRHCEISRSKITVNHLQRPQTLHTNLTVGHRDETFVDKTIFHGVTGLTLHDVVFGSFVREGDSRELQNRYVEIARTK